MIHLFQVVGQQADALVSPEHGIVAAFSGLVAFVLDYAHSYIRKKRRSETIEKTVQDEVQRILNLRAAQDTLGQANRDNDFRNLKDNVQKITDGQGKMELGITGLNTQIEAMRWGVYQALVTIKPELAAALDLGQPRG